MKNTENISQFEDIDWIELHQQCRNQKAWKSKNASDWDKKAHSFSKNSKASEYSDLFISNLELEEGDTVVDVGAGSGVLSVPIAKMGHNVTALDYSKGMLSELEIAAKHHSINNIKPVCCAWEDNWSQHCIIEHDVAIASRSLGVKDLHSALIKLNNIAKKHVYLTDRINPSPFDAEAFKHIGRSFQAGPDYIFTINMLYKLGINAEVKVLEFDRLQKYQNIEKAVARYAWMFTDITEDERQKLSDYLISRIIEENEDHILIKPKSPHRWAFIHWAPTGKL